MNDSSGKMASSLALVEKRNQRTGGCVGIFFQVFDWNRRLAKKKLFSKKLLPPVRLKKASKIFGGADKLPKLRLIAGENSGGFPCVKNNVAVSCVNSDGEREMQTPGLVARLMGLESMPAVQRDKLKKVYLSGDDAKKCVDKNDTYERKEFSVEKVNAKNELRPQKLQKTGSSDRSLASRLEAEALQLKNVLSRSRKNHQKLVSPVKSPRHLSGKNPSRLIGAATKILEPGLQRNGSRCAISSTSLRQNPRITEALTGGASDNSLDILENSNQQSSSCRNCGHLLDLMNFTPNPEGQQQGFSSESRHIDHSSEVFGRANPRVPVFCSVQEKGNKQKNAPHYAALSMENGQLFPKFKGKEMFSDVESQRQRRATCTDNIKKDGSSSVGLKDDLHGERQMFKGRANLPSRSKLNKLQSSRVSSAGNATNDNRTSIALDRKLNGHPRSRVSAQMEYCELDADRKVVQSGHASVSHPRKRRSDYISGKIDGSGFLISSFTRTTYARPDVMSGRDTNGSCPSHKLMHLQERANDNTGKSPSGAGSFTFNSQIKQQHTGIHAEADEKVYKKSSSRDVSLGKSALHEDGGMKSKHEYFPLDDDSLGAFLQQKLRELTSGAQENESGYGDTRPRKTTGVILQELISALTGGRSCQHDYLADGLQKSQGCFCNKFQLKATTASTVSPEYEHFSPGSVLEGTFSNDSFVSSNLDDNSSKFCEETLLLEPDSDPLVFATSSGMARLFRESLTFLMRNISDALSSIDIANVLLKGSRLAHAEAVILNAEMVFGNAALPAAISSGGFSICNFVQNELETIASLMWTRFCGLMGFSSGTKEGHQLKRLAFDSVIEYLDSRFSRYSYTGFNAWARLPLRMKTEMLICEIVEEIGRWMYMSGLVVDELIEYDMSRNSGKWVDFDLEAMETGVEIDQLIVDVLMDELIIDIAGVAGNEC